MAKVLVIESDSVFAAVLADRLHVAGHEVRRLSEGTRAVAVAVDQQVDLSPTATPRPRPTAWKGYCATPSRSRS